MMITITICIVNIVSLVHIRLFSARRQTDVLCKLDAARVFCKRKSCGKTRESDYISFIKKIKKFLQYADAWIIISLAVTLIA